MTVGGLFNSSIGDEQSTSYLSVDRAVLLKDNYLSAEARTLFNSTYPDLILDDSKLKADLIRATNLIDLEFKWIGNKTDEDQALDWPRTNVPVGGFETIRKVVSVSQYFRNPSIILTYNFDLLPDNQIPFDIEMGLLNTVVYSIGSDKTKDVELSEFKSVELSGVGKVQWRDGSEVKQTIDFITSISRQYLSKYGRVNKPLSNVVSIGNAPRS